MYKFSLSLFLLLFFSCSMIKNIRKSGNRTLASSTTSGKSSPVFSRNCVSLVGPLLNDDVLSESFIDEVMAGKKSLYYYSAIGSSYGGTALNRLEGYLEIGARLSPRGWDLFQKIRPILSDSLSDKEIAFIIVSFLNENTLKSTKRQKELFNLIGESSEAAELIITELNMILKDINIFKNNIAEVFEVFNRVDNFFLKNKNISSFHLARQKLKGIKKTREVRDYHRLYSKLFREQWSDSFGATAVEEVQRWKDRIAKIETSNLFQSLGKDVKELLNIQVERESAGLFYSNYGGLFNVKDRSLVWYAGGKDKYSRESFKSIQNFFAKDGITFEFIANAADRMHWREVLSMDRKLESNSVARNRTSYDTISISGNVFPGDINRVYAKEQAMLDQVRAMFEKHIGESGLRQSGITFHLIDKQSLNYVNDINKVVNPLLGGKQAPEVSPHLLGGRTFFLTDSETDQIKELKKPLYSYVVLEGEGGGTLMLEKLMKAHSEVILRDFKFNGTLYSGGEYASEGAANKPFYLNPIEEIQYFETAKKIVLEFRPEIPIEQIDALLRSEQLDKFDMRMISRIYFPESRSFDQGRMGFLKYFGLQSKYRWGVRFHKFIEMNDIYRREFDQFTNHITSKIDLNLTSKKYTQFTPPKWEVLDLTKESNRKQMFEYLTSSQHFGLRPYKNMKKVFNNKKEFNPWEKLQKLVIKMAKDKRPLSKEAIDEILLLAVEGSTGHAPVGYRRTTGIHEIWPGGKNLGDHWSFELQEVQHFYREPHFVLPDKLYRTSSTSVAAKMLSYAEPGDNIEKEIKRLVRLFDEDPRDEAFKAILLYKDLVSLHPLTDGNGRGARAVLSYLLLKKGIVPPSFELAAGGDFYLTGIEYVKFMEISINRGWQSYVWGGPPREVAADFWD